METDRNVLGGDLEECGLDPVTGFFRDGCCSTGPEDLGSHTVCAVVTAEFLAHQASVGNDLSTPRPEYGFAGLKPGGPVVCGRRAVVAGVPRRRRGSRRTGCHAPAGAGHHPARGAAAARGRRTT
ncbi:uncharacterized protein (DUF2237 family) [Kribbella italica]|uniref:Uncharacterized protein (DUF2237 family) n=1 Tax=Kribbella italica TaxID=1540520 RepID=A0A7W9J280_9ACTN|nr:uncharacterized protein (DUF2237 family) [Kribbella italica]